MEVLLFLLKVVDECIVVDFGSIDEIVVICQQFGFIVYYYVYKVYGVQMNYVIGLVSYDWVLCMDSDEIFDNDVVMVIQVLKVGEEFDLICVWCLLCYWFVLGKQVWMIYFIFLLDYLVCFFNCQQVWFNDWLVDDQVVGYVSFVRLLGFVCYDIFYLLYEVFNKLNSYIIWLVKYQQIKFLLMWGIVSVIGVFFKWYLFSGVWCYGKVGVVIGLYVMFYSFLKYFKVWYVYEDNQVFVV